MFITLHICKIEYAVNFITSMIIILEAAIETQMKNYIKTLQLIPKTIFLEGTEIPSFHE